MIVLSYFRVVAFRIDVKKDFITIEEYNSF